MPVAVKPLPRQHDVVRTELNGRPALRVVGLPVFAEHQRQWGDKTYDVNENYLKDMARWLNEREREGWLPAVHSEHNNPMGPPRPRLGFANKARVEPAVVEGKPSSVLFVDVIAEGEEALKELESRCFRSPEVNLEKGTMESLAVMASEGPWFKFPIPSFKRTDTGSFMPAEVGTPAAYAASAEGLLAYRCLDGANRAESAYYTLYRFPRAIFNRFGASPSRPTPPPAPSAPPPDIVAEAVAKRIRGALESLSCPLPLDFNEQAARFYRTDALATYVGTLVNLNADKIQRAAAVRAFKRLRGH